MYIYKITNIQNNKVYIGQTINPIEKRWKRHQSDALNNVLNTHFARAIRKYGVDAFKIEEIDKASNQDELNQKEAYWIGKYNAIEEGYNETDSIVKSGGNTYAGKTPNELNTIKQKLSDSKKGGKNPNATKIKCRNEKTQKELHFDSIAEAVDYFKESNHSFITSRCKGETKCLYKQEWNFAYEDNDYFILSEFKNNRRAKRVEITNLETKETKEFPSYAAGERYFNLPSKKLSGKAYKFKGQKEFIISNFAIKLLD